MWQNSSVSGCCWCRDKFRGFSCCSCILGPKSLIPAFGLQQQLDWARDGCLNFIDENDEVLISGFGRRGHAVASSEWMQKSEGYHRPHFIRPSDMKRKIIERSSVHEVGDIPGVRFKVVKAECHYFQEFMFVIVCFSMVFPQISLGPLGHLKWWSWMKYMKWMHNAQLQVAGCGLGALYRNKKDWQQR